LEDINNDYLKKNKKLMDNNNKNNNNKIPNKSNWSNYLNIDLFKLTQSLEKAGVLLLLGKEEKEKKVNIKIESNI
jgi:hypothetical protein